MIPFLIKARLRVFRFFFLVSLIYCQREKGDIGGPLLFAAECQACSGVKGDLVGKRT